MSKIEQITANISGNYQGWKLAGDVCWRLAEEHQVAISTVYRAIDRLRCLGAIDGKVYTGRQFVHPDEIATCAAEDGTLLLTATKQAELAKKFFATTAAISLGVQYGLRSGRMTELNGGFYGYMVRVN